MKRIVIIGAGVSGVYVSIQLKRKLGSSCEVIVLEQNSSPLKKLLATGNGRCNLSNKNLNISCYQSDKLEYVENIIHQFNMKQNMNDLGLYCVYQGDLLYPKSEQALSVKQVLMDVAENEGVIFLYNQEVYQVKNTQPYQIKTQEQIFKADYVIFAMGSEAGKLSGVSDVRYRIFEQLKLKVIPPIPSLVQLKTQPVLKQLKGVRVKGTFSLLKNNRCIHKEKGELLFTDYGVSGIAVMQISSLYEKNSNLELSIDFFDEMDDKKLYEFVELRGNKDYNHFYDGLVNSKLSLYLEKMSLTTSQEIVKVLKDFRLKIIGINSYETAQVMRGGLSLKEVDKNLEIIKYPHMYAIGEILNVAGLCGGYNLHFAFASAMQVANAIEGEYNVTNS